MDVVEPELVWVEGRCYRVCDSSVWSSEQSNAPYEEDYYQAEYGDMDDQTCNHHEELRIDLTSNGSHIHSFHVPKAFYGFIIGFKGCSKKKIETETKTTITVPKIDSKHEEIEIVGRNRSNVISCRQRLDLLIESSRSKIRYTHFVSIPLNTEDVIKNFEEFKRGVLRDAQCESRGISEDTFVVANKSHLTIGMLRLLSDEEKTKAAEVLSDCVKEVIKPILAKTQAPVTIKLQGLNYMNDEPSKVAVLYAEVLKNDILQEIADKTFQYFIHRDLMTVERLETVKLHMTLMNSKRASKHDQRFKKFDATKILQDYKDYFFGEILLKTINISDRETEAPNGNYQTIKEIDLF